MGAQQQAIEDIKSFGVASTVYPRHYMASAQQFRFDHTCKRAAAPIVNQCRPEISLPNPLAHDAINLGITKHLNFSLKLGEREAGQATREMKRPT